LKKIELNHGAGGKLMRDLIKGLFIKELENPFLSGMDDAAVFTDMGRDDIVFTTDSYVVSPLFFPGGDIGKLAVCGTVNDLAVSGAKPLYLSAGIIIEEGFELSLLKKIVKSVKEASVKAGVKIVTGDTKVVERGACDKVFINTSGIGPKPKGIKLGLKKIRTGDKIIVTGPIGQHGVSILAAREGLNFQSSVKSDCAPLNGVISRILKYSDEIRFMRDPTRGGVATVLNEIVDEMPLGILLQEDGIPMTGGVRSACELLGMDPLYMANEGRAVVVTSKAGSKKILKALKRHPQGKNASIIGEIVKEQKGRVCIKTKAGGVRLLKMLSGEQLPRIC